MRRPLFTLFSLLALSGFGPADVLAQVQLSTGTGLGFRAYAVPYEWQRMTASETFTAVLDRPTLIGFGGGVEIHRIAGGLFARAGITLNRATGERVAIVDDQVISFDPPIELTLTMMPVELGAGWRFSGRSRPGRTAGASRVVPYLGGGFLLVRYREQTAFDQDDEGEFETFRGYFGMGGLEFAAGGGVVIGGEVQYRLVPDALGAGGASAYYEETDLGGVAVRILIGFRR